MYINNQKRAFGINEMINEAENCRLGITGEINTNKAIELLKSEELNNSDFAFVTLKMIETFKGHYISESLFSAIRNMTLFLIRRRKLSMSQSAYNMTIEIDDNTNIAFIEKSIYSIITSAIGEINSKTKSGDKIAEDLRNFENGIDLVFFENVTDGIFNNIENISSSFKSTPQICKIIFAESGIINELKKEYPSFYYQIIGHTHSNHPSAVFGGYTDICRALVSELSLKHKITPGFSVAIKEYIDAVYPTADLRNREFIDDLIKRVEQQMLTVPYLFMEGNILVITEDGVPYSSKVEEQRKNKDEETERKTETSEGSKEIIPIVKLEDVREHHETKAKGYCGKKNVLLLSLSTFGRRLEESDYEYQGEYYSGIYQLDAIPKMLSYKLEKKNECLDEIIMLATKKTAGEDAQKNVTVHYKNKSEVNVEGVTPEEFFREQVVEYLNPGRKEEDRFKTFIIDNPNDPSKEIKDVVEYIRKECKDAKLFIDAHGSLRGLTVAMLAINSLLLNENRGAKEVYSIEFTPGANSRIFKDTADELFSFVSGMNEFRSFGRIDSLEKYMKYVPNKLTEGMREVADAVSVCNIDKLDNALKKIREYFDPSKKQNDDKENSDKKNYLSIFENTIKADYGKLLDSDHSVFDEVEWCLNKKLYQAALTIIESKVPEFIFGTSEKFKQEDLLDEFIQNVKISDAKMPLYIMSNDIKQKWKQQLSDSNGERVFANWVTKRICYYNKKGERCDENKKFIIDKREKIHDISESAEIIINENKVCGINQKLCGKANKTKTKEFIIWLRILKNTRNAINHALKNNMIPDVGKIDNAIKYFLDLAKDLTLALAEDFVVEGFTENTNPEKIVPCGRIIGTEDSTQNQLAQITHRSYEIYSKKHKCEINDVLKVTLLHDKSKEGRTICNIVNID